MEVRPQYALQSSRSFYYEPPNSFELTDMQTSNSATMTSSEFDEGSVLFSDDTRDEIVTIDVHAVDKDHSRQGIAW